MSEDIEFLAWSRTEEGSAALNDALAAFEAGSLHLKTSASIPTSEQMWSKIAKIAIYGQGADIGEVGSTFIASLRGMNSLRPFRPDEVNSLGGGSAFVDAVWQAGVVPEKNEVWAIPWRTDTRVIFYRRDLFAKAGINEQDAFQTPAHMEQTLQALQAGGVKLPFTMSTTSVYALTTFTASWIWGTGGDFIHLNGNVKEVVFNSAEARTGWRDYFKLGRYLAPPARGLDVHASDDLFCQGEAAVTLSGSWLPDTLALSGSARAKDNVGVALAPGVPIVGGTHLVIWKHTQKTHEAMELIRFLTSRETLTAYPKSIIIPARNDALASPVFAAMPMYETFIRAIQTGRCVPSLTLWAMVEDRLGKMLAAMWAELAQQPEADLDDLIARHVDPLAQRLNTTLNAGQAAA
jgi:multiple sugar transport system substrate-binding protein